MHTAKNLLSATESVENGASNSWCFPVHWIFATLVWKFGSLFSQAVTVLLMQDSENPVMIT